MRQCATVLALHQPVCGCSFRRGDQQLERYNVGVVERIDHIRQFGVFGRDIGADDVEPGRRFWRRGLRIEAGEIERVEVSRG